MSNAYLLESESNCSEQYRKEVGLASVEIERLMRENGINKAELLAEVVCGDGTVYEDLIKITVGDQGPIQVGP